jgi:murein L,D-transpeptidase YcbB/YkuD
MFDEAVERGLINFQRRHGLDPDGALGPSTLAALNVPLEARIRQIKVNMERCRWLPQDLGNRYIAVNIANFSLDVMEENEPVLSMRVVVGKKVQRTPVFSSEINQIVFSPTWTVPKKIAGTELLPKVQNDINYLAQENFTVYDSYEDDARVVDPTQINWSHMTAETLPFRFRQRSGPLNALGRVKFLFPNTFDVYLHDTPARELFHQTVRTFSHGCIRVEKPIELAAYLLHNNKSWTDEAIRSATKRTEEQYVDVFDHMPIHILYWTAWVSERGKMEFRDDIYGRDETLAKALESQTLTHELDK